jgi:hypothetical protein
MTNTPTKNEKPFSVRDFIYNACLSRGLSDKYATAIADFLSQWLRKKSK